MDGTPVKAADGDSSAWVDGMWRGCCALTSRHFVGDGAGLTQSAGRTLKNTKSNFLADWAIY